MSYELAKSSIGKFKIGDRCRIKPRPYHSGSIDARLYEGMTSKIVSLHGGYAVLEIEYPRPSGIWLDELELLDFSDDDYETV